MNEYIPKYYDIMIQNGVATCPLSWACRWGEEGLLYMLARRLRAAGQEALETGMPTSR